MKLCIYNARLVTSAGEKIGGILVGDDGRIEKVLRGGKGARADTLIDAKGKLLFAGFIDAHVHMRDPGFTHKEDFISGTTAAACAGVRTARQRMARQGTRLRLVARLVERQPRVQPCGRTPPVCDLRRHECTGQRPRRGPGAPDRFALARGDRAERKVARGSRGRSAV